MPSATSTTVPVALEVATLSSNACTVMPSPAIAIAPATPTLVPPAPEIACTVKMPASVSVSLVPVVNEPAVRPISGADTGLSISAWMIAWPVCSASAAPIPTPRASAEASALVVAMTCPFAVRSIPCAVTASFAAVSGSTVAETRPITTPSAIAAATPNDPSASAGVGSATPAGLPTKPSPWAITAAALGELAWVPCGPPFAAVMLLVSPVAVSDTVSRATTTAAVVASVLSSTMPSANTPDCAPDSVMPVVCTSLVWVAVRVRLPCTVTVAPVSSSAEAVSCPR